MKLNKEQALYCAQYMEDYYHHFDRIDDYMRSQKLAQVAEMPICLPGCGPEEDLFSDFSIDIFSSDCSFCSWSVYSICCV
jgi:hypothetical protein